MSRTVPPRVKLPLYSFRRMETAPRTFGSTASRGFCIIDDQTRTPNVIVPDTMASPDADGSAAIAPRVIEHDRSLPGVFSGSWLLTRSKIPSFRAWDVSAENRALDAAASKLIPHR